MSSQTALTWKMLKSQLLESEFMDLLGRFYWKELSGSLKQKLRNE